MSVSFRDPSGKLFSHKGVFYRAINQIGEADFRRALASPVISGFVERDELVGVYKLSDENQAQLLEDVAAKSTLSLEKVSLLVKHNRVPFRSYPYEWTPEMLHSAAMLTLKLAKELLSEGMGIKDATPYNVLFVGPKPIFVDWLSFEVRDALDPIWLAQSQFLRTFCLPLLANKYFQTQLMSIFRDNRDGLEPEAIYPLCSFLQKIRPPFLTNVTIPKLLSSKKGTSGGLYKPHKFDDPEKARYVLSRQFHSLERLLNKLAPAAEPKSDWSEYVGDKQHFTDRYFGRKSEFVEDALAEMKKGRILDVGCNTGHFSRIAAKSGSSVVAIDQDSASVSMVWKLANKENLDILPLTVDFSRPTPAMGWRNQECPSFLERAKGKIDGILMLAVLHHLLVSERIPLSKVIELTADLVGDFAIIEFVPPNDPMFKQIARGRDDLFVNLTVEGFRDECSKHFRILRSEKLPDCDREIYLLQR